MIPLAKPWFNENELNNVKQVFDSGMVSEFTATREFENKVKKLVGTQHAIALTNCTVALWLSLKALKLPKDSEILVPAFTYPATAQVATDLGYKVNFCDVDLRTYNTTAKLIEGRLTTDTKAIIPVHLFGLSAQMPDIMKLANTNGLKVIEDAACSLGARFNGKQCGGWGDTGCFSFHARKCVSCGEGGMLTTDNGELAKKLRLLKRFGWDGKRDFLLDGLNFKLPDILGAVGSAQMDKLGMVINRRREIAKLYDQYFLEEFSDEIIIPYVPKQAFHIYQSYVVRLADGIDRDKVILKMKERGIQTQIGTYAVHKTTTYNSPAYLPNTDKLYNQCLALPIFYEMPDMHVGMVVDELGKLVRSKLINNSL